MKSLSAENPLWHEISPILLEDIFFSKILFISVGYLPDNFNPVSLPRFKFKMITVFLQTALEKQTDVKNSQTSFVIPQGKSALIKSNLKSLGQQ